MKKNKKPETIISGADSANVQDFPTMPENLTKKEQQRWLFDKLLNDVLIFAESNPVFALDLSKAVIERLGGDEWLQEIIQKELHKVKTGRYPRNTWSGEKGERTLKRLHRFYYTQTKAGVPREKALEICARVFGLTGNNALDHIEERITQANNLFK